MEIIKKIVKIRPIATVILVTIMANAFVAWYVNSQETVYYWDLSRYWIAAISLRASFGDSFNGGLQELISSLNTDYTFLPILPVVLVMEIFGDSRYVFVASILNLYVVPVGLILSSLVSKTLSRCHKGLERIILPAVYTTVMLTPAIYLPILRGSPDLSGLLMFMITIWLIVRFRPWNRASLAFCILFGLSISGLLLSRRWYAFLMVGIFALAVVAVTYVLYLARTSKLSIKDVDSIFRNLSSNTVIAALVTVVTLGLASPHLLESYMTNYSDLYSAYKSGGLAVQLRLLVDYFGLLTLLLAGSGYFLSFLNTNLNRARSFISLFILFLAVVVFVSFTRIQNFEYHHYYLLLPTIVWGVVTLLVSLLEMRKHKLMLATFAIMFFVMINAFVHPLHTPSRSTSWLLGTSNPPTVRNDIEELRRIANWAKGSDGDVYVLSSSPTLNHTTLENVYLPEIPLTPNILAPSEIDKRDGFPRHFFQAEYLLVGLPAQTHLSHGQLVVTSLVDNITKHSPRNLKEINRYRLSGGVEAILYKRIAPYDDIFIDSVRKDFQLAYPNYPNLVNI